MHDPMTLAHRIVSPIPRISKSKQLGRSIRDGRKWQWTIRLRPFAKHNYISPFIYIAGYELYFHSILEIWHTDPLGDAGPACHGRKHWKWHIHHMSIAPTFWYTFRQRHITRCAYCGNRSNKQLGLVNFSNGAKHVSYHQKCIGLYSNMIHEHNPATCYACSGSAAFEAQRAERRLPEIQPYMPAAQRELLDSLKVMTDLGLLPYSEAVDRYKKAKKAAAWR